MTEYMPGASPGTAVPISTFTPNRDKVTKYISPNSLEDSMEYAVMSFLLRRFASGSLLIYPAGGRFSEYMWNYHEAFNIWKEYFELMHLQCKYQPVTENPRIFKPEKPLSYIATKSDFERDVFMLLFPYRVNHIHHHHEYLHPELIGSFSYTLTSELDCCKKTKKLSIEISNTLSTSSLTRNPFNRKPLIEREVFGELNIKILIKKEGAFEI